MIAYFKLFMSNLKKSFLEYNQKKIAAGAAIFKQLTDQLITSYLAYHDLAVLVRL